MVKSKKIFFPFGILLLCTAVFSGGGAAGSALYFYIAAKKEIAEAERFTQNSLAPVLEACVQMAQLDGGKESAGRLNSLFRDYRLGNIVSRAFFVSENGRILAHSDRNESKRLNDNIASDEFSYNLDQIFRPARKNMREPYFDDYYLIDRKIPFDREKTALLKKYLYQGMDRNGWILSRQVVYKGKTVGVIAFLSDKEMIYDRIAFNYRECVFWMKICTLAGAGLALIFSMIVFIRYQMIYIRASRRQEREREDLPQTVPPQSFFAETAAAEEPVLAELAQNTVPVYTEYELHARSYTDYKAPVQDAIPVRKK